MTTHAHAVQQMIAQARANNQAWTAANMAAPPAIATSEAAQVLVGPRKTSYLRVAGNRAVLGLLFDWNDGNEMLALVDADVQANPVFDAVQNVLERAQSRDKRSTVEYTDVVSVAVPTNDPDFLFSDAQVRVNLGTEGNVKLELVVKVRNSEEVMSATLYPVGKMAWKV